MPKDLCYQRKSNETMLYDVNTKKLKKFINLQSIERKGCQRIVIFFMIMTHCGE